MYRFSDSGSIENAILATDFYGSFTNTSGALWRLVHDQFQASRGDRPDVQNVGVVLTDGHSNLDEDLIPFYNNLVDVSAAKILLLLSC